MSRPHVQLRGDGVRLSVRVKPRASRSQVLGWKDVGLEVAVAAPPVDGKANQELQRTLASWLGVPPSRVAIVKGQNAQRKVVEVTASADEIAAIRTRLDQL